MLVHAELHRVERGLPQFRVEAVAVVETGGGRERQLLRTDSGVMQHQRLRILREIELQITAPGAPEWDCKAVPPGAADVAVGEITIVNLTAHPAVVECAVTAAPDPVRGKVVKASIILAKGYEPSDELTKELQDHVKHTTAPYKYPRIVEYVDDLPKTIGGKIKRKMIRNADGVTD